jgi:hypothetical protein
MYGTTVTFIANDGMSDTGCFHVGAEGSACPILKNKRERESKNILVMFQYNGTVKEHTFNTPLKYKKSTENNSCL